MSNEKDEELDIDVQIINEWEAQAAKNEPRNGPGGWDGDQGGPFSKSISSIRDPSRTQQHIDTVTSLGVRPLSPQAYLMREARLRQIEENNGLLPLVIRPAKVSSFPYNPPSVLGLFRFFTYQVKPWRAIQLTLMVVWEKLKGLFSRGTSRSV